MVEPLEATPCVPAESPAESRAAPPVVARPRARLRRLVLDAEGRLAVGWRVLLYAVALVAAQLVAAGLERIVGASRWPEPLRGLLFAVAYGGATLGLVLLLRRRVDRRPPGALGVSGGVRLREALAGFAVGLAMLAVVVAVEWGAGWVRVAGITAWPREAAGRVARAFFVMCAVGFCEELAFRGGILANLAERRSVRSATTVSAVLFGAAHLISAPPTPAVLVSALAATTLLVASRLRTGALWWAIGWHVAWDFGQARVFGLDPQGGAAVLVRLVQSGPPLWVGVPGFIESGLVIVLVQAAAAMLAARTGPRMRWRRSLDASSGAIAARQR